MILPARFDNCLRCGRLITVGGINPAGVCTADCGGSVDSAEPPEPLPAWAAAMSTAHYCPSVETGDPADCGFGNVGCRDSAPDSTEPEES